MRVYKKELGIVKQAVLCCRFLPYKPYNLQHIVTLSSKRIYGKNKRIFVAIVARRLKSGKATGNKRNEKVKKGDFVHKRSRWCYEIL